RADAFDEGPLGTQGGEVVPDAAALLHRQRRFLDVLEDRTEVVLDAPHDEAVEERHLAAAGGPGDDAARRQELEAGQRLEIALGPTLARLPAALLDGGCRARDPAERVLQRAVDRFAVSRLQPVLLLPNMFRDRADAERVWMHDGLRWDLMRLARSPHPRQQ